MSPPIKTIRSSIDTLKDLTWPAKSRVSSRESASAAALRFSFEEDEGGVSMPVGLISELESRGARVVPIYTGYLVFRVPVQGYFKNESGWTIVDTVINVT